MPPEWFPSLSPEIRDGGVRFTVHAAGPPPRLQIYGAPGDRAPARVLALEPHHRRADGLWEVFVEGAGAGTLYTWAAGESDRPLLDPWALAVQGPPRFGVRDSARGAENTVARFKGGVLPPPPPLKVARPGIDLRNSVLYELHVRGFTRHPSSGVARPGTFSGLAEKIPYLSDLGVTAVELMPVQEFDETSQTGELRNVWGYGTIDWFCPNRRYAADCERLLGPIEEFRAMVEAFHEAGIAVIADVVFNHSAELGKGGPVYNLRGLDDDLYYLKDPAGRYLDLTGCKNTVRCQHPLVRRLVREALRWWVHALGVDGFRFDLATILALDESGEPMDDPPLLREIESDPLLEGVLLIAEPWDAAGGYRVSDWPGAARWAVWNDAFRDDVRRAWMSRTDLQGVLATRLCGSEDRFRGRGAGPLRGVQYVTSHDGFTLRDAVSYERRHNLANGEGGLDGNPSEPSVNFGEEGPTGDAGITAARDRARRNLLASLLCAQGVPMLCAGDEIGRTQRGNNNPYRDDSPLTWVDWSGMESQAGLHAFVRRLLRIRAERRVLTRDRFLQGSDHDGDGFPDVSWVGPEGAPRWDEPDGCFGALFSGSRGETGGERDEPDLLLLVNLSAQPVAFALPTPRGKNAAWHVLLDTATAPETPATSPIPTAPFPLPPQSLLLLSA